MKEKKVLTLSCSEAATFCDQQEYDETGFWNKLKLKFHLFFCRSCKNYHSRNRKLSLLIKKADISTFSKNEKETFKKQLTSQRSQDIFKKD